MDINIITFLSICFTVIDAFFLFADKNEPIWLCFKICPLYCGRRRHDEDASSLVYWDEDYGYVHEEPEVIVPYHYFCKPPKPKTTTTPKPTTMATTTEEPTWICMVCKKKCGNVINKSSKN